MNNGMKNTAYSGNNEFRMLANIGSGTPTRLSFMTTLCMRIVPPITANVYGATKKTNNNL